MLKNICIWKILYLKMKLLIHLMFFQKNYFFFVSDIWHCIVLEDSWKMNHINVVENSLNCSQSLICCFDCLLGWMMPFISLVSFHLNIVCSFSFGLFIIVIVNLHSSVILFILKQKNDYLFCRCCCFLNNLYIGYDAMS